MAPANGPTPRDKAPSKKRRRPKRKTKAKKENTETKQPAEAPKQTAPKQMKPQQHTPPETEKGKKAAVEQALMILHEVVLAIQAKKDPLPVIINGMTELIKIQWMA
ncbi:hypothetical protein O0L34_g9303 [Tuta absoluta]|nr:hypothetical protein O0L34_g13457 [Tuta absoluta]KAJ2945232.1 hypothetical protein O0L34_g9303 [Tuta absoluta]